MNLIKLGTRIVNLDTVTNVDMNYVTSDDQSGIRVYFGEESETFRGTMATALRSWLESITTDIVAIYDADQKAIEYVKAANARTCATCGGDGCPDCDRSRLDEIFY